MGKPREIDQPLLIVTERRHSTGDRRGAQPPRRGPGPDPVARHPRRSLRRDQGRAALRRGGRIQRLRREGRHPRVSHRSLQHPRGSHAGHVGAARRRAPGDTRVGRLLRARLRVRGQVGARILLRRAREGDRGKKEL